MRTTTRIFHLSLAFAWSLCSTPLMAAPDEIEVYTDEMSKPGQIGMELHLNHAIVGAQTPAYLGQTPSHHLTQTTPEFFYGLTPSLEAGLYLPLAIDSKGNSYLNGLRMRLKYIAPHNDNDGLFWGLNGEIGHASIRTSESASVAELRPIVGYRDGHWLASFNPILNMALSANFSHQPRFEPALKVTRGISEAVHIGTEYYGEYGTATNFLASSQRSHSLYAVADIESRNYDVNFGIGRGYVNASDRWVMKAIITRPFN